MLAIIGNGHQTRRQASGANGGCAAPRDDHKIRQWCPTAVGLVTPDAGDAKRNRDPVAQWEQFLDSTFRIRQTRVN